MSEAWTELQREEAGPCALGCRQSLGWGGRRRCTDEFFTETLQ